MKTEQPAPVADADRSPTLPYIGGVPKGVDPGFVTGGDARLADGRTVAYAIHIMGDFKVGDRDFSGTLTLHEALILRRYYEELGGSIQVRTTWPIGHKRFVPMTQEQLTVEVKRLGDSFTIAQQGGKLDIAALYLGATKGEQIRKLHEIMAKQMKAWEELMVKAIARVPMAERAEGIDPRVVTWTANRYITEDELMSVINLADSTLDGVKDFTLDEVSAPSDGIPYTQAPVGEPGKSIETLLTEAEAGVGAPPDDAIDQTIARLKAAGLDETQALTVASMQEMLEGSGEIAEADLTSAIGSAAKSKIAAVRKALRG